MVLRPVAARASEAVDTPVRLDCIRSRAPPPVRFLRGLPSNPAAGGVPRSVTGIQAMRRPALAKAGLPRSWARSAALRSSPPP